MSIMLPLYPGLHSPGYWSYTALVMANRLAAMVQSGQCDSSIVPKGVLKDAKRFFSLVHDETDPVANAHSIALRTLRQCTIPLADPGIRECLWRFQTFLNGLDGEPRGLTKEERFTAEALEEFFRELHKWSSRYVGPRGQEAWERESVILPD